MMPMKKKLFFAVLLLSTLYSLSLHSQEVSQLFTRHQYIPELGAIKESVHDIIYLPSWIGGELQGSEFRKMEIKGINLTLPFFIVIMAVALGIVRALVAYIRRTLNKFARPFADRAREDYASLLIFGAFRFVSQNIFYPLSLVAVFLLAELFKFPRSLSISILATLAALTVFGLLKHLLIIVYDPKDTGLRIVNLKREPAIRVYRWLLTSSWTLVFPILILFLLKWNAYKVEITDFAVFIFRILIIVCAAWALFLRKELFYWERPPAAGLSRFLYQLGYFLYYPLAVSVLGVLGAAVIGYQGLSNFVLGRVGLVGLVVLTAAVVNKILKEQINSRVRSLARDEVSSFYGYEEKRIENLRPALLFGVKWGVILGALYFITVVLGLGWESFYLGGLRKAIVTPFLKAALTEISVASVVKGGFVLLIFLYSSRLIRALLFDIVFPKLKTDRGAQVAINTSIHYGLLILGVVVMLGVVGISWSTIMVFVGALGVGAGFGLQNVVSNFVSGLILRFERPVREGDYVRIRDECGLVLKIGVRSTTVTTRDNIILIVPNSELINMTFANYSLKDPKTRVRIPVSVAYGTDIGLVEKLLVKIADECPKVLKQPSPAVFFKEFGESSLNFELMAWVENPTVVIQDEINRAIDKAFREHGIVIPFPQREVRIVK